jgi:hypothetical protein
MATGYRPDASVVNRGTPYSIQPQTEIRVASPD